MTTRRDFLHSTAKILGTYFVTAGLPVRPGLAASDGRPGRSELRYPQGVASGDPTPDGIVLWTRTQPANGETDIAVTLQCSLRRDFRTVAAELPVQALAAADHTVRVVVTGLRPDTTYYYRFLDGSRLASPTGRTRTAPEPGADRRLRFAFASCQLYQTGHYHAYRHLLERERGGRPEDRIDFVLFLGDFIYEVIFPPELAVPGRSLSLPSRPTDGSNPMYGQKLDLQYAVSTDEYRFLYKTYLSDPHLKAARQNWPFVCIWDDHDFTNDHWQSMCVDTLEGVPSQQRRVSANQAWFEYIPQMLSDLGDGQPAKDFKAVAVENAPFDAVDDFNHVLEPNNRAAIDSITVSRHFHWGRNLDLIITDSRSYRSDHPVPETLGQRLSPFPRAMLPRSFVNELDAGKTAFGGQPRKQIEVRGEPYENPRVDRPVGTMYGHEQKQWVKRVLENSTAAWKVCVNSVPMLPLAWDFRIEPDKVVADDVVMTDSWDGYNAERKEMLDFLSDRRIANYVSLTGDHHMHFAGHLVAGPDEDPAQAVAVEFCCAGLSSTSYGDMMFTFGKRGLGGPEGSKVLVGPKSNLPDGRMPWLGVTWLYGWEESLKLAKRLDAGEAALPDPEARRLRHIRYMDAGSYGVGVAEVGPDSFAVDFLVFTQEQERADYAQPQSPAYLARFRAPRREAGAPVALEGPVFLGIPPYPYRSG